MNDINDTNDDVKPVCWVTNCYERPAEGSLVCWRCDEELRARWQHTLANASARALLRA